MGIYFVVYAVIFALAGVLAGKHVEELRKRKICSFVISLVLMLLFTLRKYTMGKDLINWIPLQGYVGYIPSFRNIGKLSWAEVFRLREYQNYEKGFILFLKLVHVISNGDYQILFAICAAAYIIPLAVLFHKRSCSLIFSYIIFLGLPVFLMLFSGLRQDIAMGLCILSVLFIQRRQFVPFLLLVLLAAQFHSSAYIFLLAYPLYFLQLNFTLRIVSIFALPFIFALRFPLFNLFAMVFHPGASAESSNSYTLFIIFVLIYLFCVLFSDADEEQNGFLNFFFLSCVFQCFANVHVLAMRMGFYYMVFLALLLPRVIMSLKNQTERTIMTLITGGAFVGFSFYSLATTRWAEAVPYIFFWQ